MKVDGACHCGEIAWEAEIDPQAVMICHCSDCQIMGGGAFQWGVLVPVDDFRLIRGEPRSYRKQGTSGAWRRVAFCGTCSSPLHGGDDVAPQTLSLRLSGCRQARDLVPGFQLWRASALGWVDDIAQFKAFETQPNAILDQR